MKHLSTLIFFIPFYLIGAFPTGRIVAKRYGVSLESVGSGSVGATNVARSIGKGAGLITLIGDVLKGIIGVIIAHACFTDSYFTGYSFIGWSGAAIVAGHCFSIPGKLKGGKGIATSLGVLLCLSWKIALISFAAFGLIFFIVRIVSISSIGAAIIVAILALMMHEALPYRLPMIIISCITIFRHKENIQRLIAGTEKQFSLGNKRSA